MAPLFDEENDYICDDDIDMFATALIWEDDDDTNLNTPANASLPNLYEETKREAELLAREELGQDAFILSPTGHSLPRRKLATPSSEYNKPTMIKSKSDWFPMGSPAPKKKSKDDKLTNEFRILASYTLFRWPLLCCIIIWVSFLCLFYAIVRAYVALLEWFFTWTGERQRLRKQLRGLKTYAEWVENAISLDKYLGLDRWSDNPRFSYYDYKTIQKTIKKLRVLRENGDTVGLAVLLQGCLKKNFAGIENRQLYSHRYYGTKKLVNEYVEEVTRCIDSVTDASEEQLLIKQKRSFFRVVLKNYGKTALCLSGGACFAYAHFGLVKALLDNDLLPLIISGTSGGGVIAALACTRTDDELRKLLVPELARKITACEDPWYVWIPRLWRTGARFDAVAWARKSNFFTKGSTTFQEAYKMTGRKLNISTVPAEPHLPVILCNSITSPNCIIWSSLLASSAVPGILNPVVLMMKDPSNGTVVPFSMGNKWRDGSLRTDIPVEALNTYYNVNFSIVSQVNPHISLFFFAPKGTVGRPVAIPRRKTRRQKFASLRGGFVATALEQLFKLEIKKWLQIVKTLDLLPRWLEQDLMNVWLQRFTGSITIWPRLRLGDFWYILLDPTEARMQEYLLKGERSMFPRLLFVKHRLSIENAIDRGRKMTKQVGVLDQVATSKSPSVIASDSEIRHMNQLLEVLNDDDDSDSSDEEVKRLIISPFDRSYKQLASESESDTETGTDSDGPTQALEAVASFSDSSEVEAKIMHRNTGRRE